MSSHGVMRLMSSNAMSDSPVAASMRSWWNICCVMVVPLLAQEAMKTSPGCGA
ncbi:hypothetical protein [Qipengyuania sp.]|uniref:hypothetical protein n=1 Tax=Qipengyuania sp. TaxID=2004515 RepID=UPI003AF96239